MSDSPRDPLFIGSESDPSRAEPISTGEYHRLSAALETLVLPILTRTAALLAAWGSEITKLRACPAEAALGITHRRLKIDAWLYMQIHPSFAPLVTSEPVFWMFSLRRDDKLVAAVPGRLHDLRYPEPVQAVADEFVLLCEAALNES